MPATSARLILLASQRGIGETAAEHRKAGASLDAGAVSTLDINHDLYLFYFYQRNFEVQCTSESD